MITIVDPEKQYKPKFGDVLWGAAADWVHCPEDEEPDSMRKCGLQLNVVDGKEEKSDFIHLGIIDPNPFTALARLGIEPQWFEGVKHKDPYTQQNVYGVIPTAVISQDIQKYAEPLKRTGFFYDGMLEAAWWRTIWKKDFLKLGDVAALFLGSGYNCGCGINDGSHKLVPAKLKLSNGDWLYVWFWEWYNK